MGMFSLEKTGWRGDMIALLFSIIPECRTCNSALNLQEARFWLNSRENVLTIRAVRQWYQLPEEVVSATTLETFKRNLDNHLADIF